MPRGGPMFSDSGKMGRFLETERAAEMYCNEEVDGAGRKLYLDEVGSVSGLGLGRDFCIWPTDRFTDEQFLRFQADPSEGG